MNEKDQNPISINALVIEANVAQPGDVVILNYPGVLSVTQRRAILDATDHIGTAHGIKFVVIDGGVQVTVGRNGNSEAA